MGRRVTLVRMIPSLRQDFNARFTYDKYRRMRAELDRHTRTAIDIRVAETPVFLPAAMVAEMVDAGAAMTHQLLSDTEYLRMAEETIPPAFRVAHTDAHPNFMTVDFGLVRESDGTLTPRLVELQAFPSVYGYQAALGEAYLRAFQLDTQLSRFIGVDEDQYWEAMRQVIVGNHAPENVILMEVTPDQQKTLPDFRVHEDRLDIRTIDITQVRQRGTKLFYNRDGVETPIERIYNRAIVDEMLRKNIQPGFDLTADLDVEWAGHPNWYFMISKFSLPFLRHPSVPPSFFLDEWMRGEHRERLPADRADWILKPLFSFAGKGIEFAPSDELLHSIPTDQRRNYLLQQRMDFASTVETPYGPTQAEIRILYVWPDDGDLRAINTLVRLGRGKMMGVDHNRDQLWVGGSAGLILG
ncbi:hypothetical protein Terro_1646 [Terriglobus roseus DSM 18391]|uniref:Circularly permuted type 2 ATP-grasp protein n=2 Tax=Terriglobus roseus TaxID=392734 RepID=I3ZFD1_TERRK|nr:hypothetical protein Terro_1646 [Terriglobus roseus DSM 18391]